MLEIVIHSAEGKLEPITEEVATLYDALIGSAARNVKLDGVTYIRRSSSR